MIMQSGSLFLSLAISSSVASVFLRARRSRFVRLANGDKSLTWVPHRSSVLNSVRVANGETSLTLGSKRTNCLRCVKFLNGDTSLTCVSRAHKIESSSGLPTASSPLRHTAQFQRVQLKVVKRRQSCSLRAIHIQAPEIPKSCQRGKIAHLRACQDKAFQIRQVFQW